MRLAHHLRTLFRVKCPICRDRTRYLTAHLWVNHIGEGS